MTLKCDCGRGAASEVDHQCKFCRETHFSRTDAKRVGVKHRGDGMTLEQALKIVSKRGV